GRDRGRGQSTLAARREPGDPPLRPPRTWGAHRAGGDRLAAPRGGACRLPFPDRLAKDRRAVLEKRGNPRRRKIGRTPRRRRGGVGAVEGAVGEAPLP